MAEVTTLFWDVGGVVLSNGWDRDARESACGRFGLTAVAIGAGILYGLSLLPRGRQS